MSALQQLSHHDQEDARQDAWVAALEKGRDDPAYRRGCERICAIEVMRQNDRHRTLANAWRVSNVHVAVVCSHGDRGEGWTTVYEVEWSTHLLPHRDEYRSRIRQLKRAAYARRRAA